MLTGTYFTVREAADRLGVTPGRIRQLIVEKRIESIIVGTVRLIPEAELKRLECTRQPTKRLPKKRDVDKA